MQESSHFERANTLRVHLKMDPDLKLELELIIKLELIFSRLCLQ